MNSRDFCYWLQGAFEVMDTKELNEKQLQIVKNHLNMVFIHEIDPSMGDKDMQDKLNKAHKPSLEELGEEHGFEVKKKRFRGHGCDNNGNVMRC